MNTKMMKRRMKVKRMLKLKRKRRNQKVRRKRKKTRRINMKFSGRIMARTSSSE